MWSVSIGGCGLYQMVGVVLDDYLICCYLGSFTIVFLNVCIFSVGVQVLWPQSSVHQPMLSSPE